GVASPGRPGRAGGGRLGGLAHRPRSARSARRRAGGAPREVAQRIARGSGCDPARRSRDAGAPRRRRTAAPLAPFAPVGGGDRVRFRTLRFAPFGPFSDFALELDPGVNLVFGRNEAGKSTALRAVRGLLFGIPERTQ